MLLRNPSILAIISAIFVTTSIDTAAFVVSPSTRSVAFRTVSTHTFAENAEKAEKAEKDEKDKKDNEAEDSEKETAAADDILNSPAFLKKKLDILKADIEQADADIAAENAAMDAAKEEFEPEIQRLEREFSHVRARAFNETMSADERASVKVVSAVLATMDNFGRAFQSIKCETESEKAVEAKYREILDMNNACLEKIGAVAIETIGQQFDYEIHQAVTQMPMEGFEENTICMEYEKGYMIGETLVRPALVVVAS